MDVNNLMSLPSNELEELAYAMQVEVDYPLQEKDRRKVVGDITYMSKFPEHFQEKAIVERRSLERSRKGKECENVQAPLTLKDTGLMSNDQILFLPDKLTGRLKYYCIDRHPDTLHQLLNLGYNPYNRQPLTDEQQTIIKEAIEHNPYPIIEGGVDDFLDEYDKRIKGKITVYDEPMYIRRADKLAKLIKDRVGIEDYASIIYAFATTLDVNQYNYFLRHPSYHYEIKEKEVEDGTEIIKDRNTVAAEALGVLERYYETMNSTNKEQGTSALAEIGQTIDEFMAMVRNGWTYQELVENKGVEEQGIKRIAWNPMMYKFEFHDNGTISSQYALNASGDIEGPYKEWDIHGNITEEGNLKNNVIDGERKLYENGKLTSIQIYDGGMLLSATFYFPNGDISMKGPYNDEGEKDGEWDVYSPLDHSFLGKAKYDQDVAIKGPVVSIESNDYENPLESFLVIFHQNDNGTRSSEKYYYTYEDPNKFSIREERLNPRTVSDEIVAADTIVYHRNGKIMTTGTTRDDKRIGIWKNYSETGDRLPDSEYENGKVINGFYREWIDKYKYSYAFLNTGIKANGNPVDWMRVFYIDSITKIPKLIEFRQLSDDGLIQSVEHYVNGVLVVKAYYNNDNRIAKVEFYFVTGNLYVSAIYDDRLVVYDSQGNEIENSGGSILKAGDTYIITVREPEKDGFERKINSRVTKNTLVGLVDSYLNEDKAVLNNTVYYPDGKIRSTTTRVGFNTVILKEYFPNGDIKLHSKHVNNQLEGKYFECDTIDKRCSEGEYANGQKTGLWIVYEFDEVNGKGRIIERGPYDHDEQHGQWTSWDYDENTKTVGNYYRGTAVGDWNTYNHLGELIETRVFLFVDELSENSSDDDQELILISSDEENNDLSVIDEEPEITPQPIPIQWDAEEDEYDENVSDFELDI